MDDAFRIRQIKFRLLRLIISPTVGVKRVPSATMELLKELRRTPMTLSILISTKIGLTVNEVAQKGVSEEVTEFALQIVSEWKQLLPRKIENRAKQTIKLNQTNQTKSLMIFGRTRAKPIIQIGDKKTEKTSEKTSQKVSEKDLQKVPQKAQQKVQKKVPEKVPENVSVKKAEKVSELGKLDKKHPKNLNQSRAESSKSVKPVAKLPPIGQMPEYKFGQTSSKLLNSRNKQMKTGNQIYNEIINKRKRERSQVARYDGIKKFKPTSSWTAPTPTFTTTNENLSKDTDYKVQNWPIPRSQPFITPKDRIRIVQSRVQDPAQPAERDLRIFKDENEPELNISRVRSAKVFNTVVPRKEHKPKWL